MPNTEKNEHNTLSDYKELLKGYYFTDQSLLKLIESYKFTPYEMAVCFFICKQVALKDIAHILGHSYDSVKKAKQRISERLRLTDKNMPIDKYLLYFLSSNIE